MGLARIRPLPRDFGQEDERVSRSPQSQQETSEPELRVEAGLAVSPQGAEDLGSLRESPLAAEQLRKLIAIALVLLGKRRLERITLRRHLPRRREVVCGHEGLQQRQAEVRSLRVTGELVTQQRGGFAGAIRAPQDPCLHEDEVVAVVREGRRRGGADRERSLDVLQALMQVHVQLDQFQVVRTDLAGGLHLAESLAVAPGLGQQKPVASPVAGLLRMCPRQRRRDFEGVALPARTHERVEEGRAEALDTGRQTKCALQVREGGDTIALLQQRTAELKLRRRPGGQLRVGALDRPRSVGGRRGDGQGTDDHDHQQKQPRGEHGVSAPAMAGRQGWSPSRPGSAAMRSRASRAASCSAAFLFGPSPRPRSLPSKVTHTLNTRS